MERLTSTTVSELSPGDRFYFFGDKKKVVYEIMIANYYNRINAWGYKMLPHDILANPSREVIFLRHKNEINERH